MKAKNTEGCKNDGRLTRRCPPPPRSLSPPPAGARISTFTQADLASRGIQYVHSSEEEKHADQFSFTVSDGTNEVSGTSRVLLQGPSEAQWGKRRCSVCEGVFVRGPSAANTTATSVIALQQYLFSPLRPLC